MPSTWTSIKDDIELCNYVQKKPYGTSVGDLKVYCKRLMPMIPMGVAKIWRVGINKSIYKNAPECAITVPNQIPLQNFLTAYRPRTPGYSYHEYDYGSELTAEAIDKLMLEARLTTNIDNSTWHTDGAQHTSVTQFKG